MALSREPTDRSRKTRRLLGEALLQLALEKGMDQVTVRDITQRAGLDRSTFYLHFRDKRALLEATRRQLVDDLVAQGAPHRTIGGRLLAAFRHMAQHAAAYRALLASADPGLEHSLHDYLAGHVARTLATHVERLCGDADAPAPPTSLQADLFAQYVAGGLRAIAKWWLEGGMPCPPEEIADMVLQLLPAGAARGRPSEG